MKNCDTCEKPCRRRTRCGRCNRLACKKCLYTMHNLTDSGCAFRPKTGMFAGMLCKVDFSAARRLS